jgi:2-haloacid dehalogenase
MIKTVFLDLDDTILDFQKGERRAIWQTFAEIGIEPSEKIIEKYMEINLSCWRALERGEMTRNEVLLGRFDRLFDELSFNGDSKATQRLYQSLLAREHDFLEGGKELLEDFRRGGKYSLYMATNGIPEVQKPRIADSGVGEYFTDIFISEEIGCAKPQREFFERCFARIEDFRRDECIIVGDSLSSDIQGGINAGILTCHFNPKDKPYTKVTPDYKITRLSELIPLLDSIN